MTLGRPDPDALLERVRTEEARGRRGVLRIFFGYAAGVGKTYSMLEAARRAEAVGRDVVVGYVEPHGRRETEALLEGLESIPPRSIDYRGVPLREFDLDVALARKPEVLLVDELAHTNAEGCRHARRWQDVEELLEAGINVWTTLNVQHIDSLNDVIGRITGISVRETVPDGVFDRADDLVLVDLSPEELIERLKAGRVYVPDQAERALANFFQHSNLVALREFSLRQAARRVHTDVESARRRSSSDEPWPTAETLMVCVGPSPTTAQVVRTAKRMAAAFDAPWLAVAVDRVGAESDPTVKERIAGHFRLADRLGAETIQLSGQDVASTLLELARSRNVTKILIGKTNQPRWRRLLFGTVVDEVLERSGDIDVYVIRGDEDPARRATTRRPRTRSERTPYLKALGIIAAGSLIAAGFDRLGLNEANIVMAFLAAAALAAARYGRGPAVLASVAAALIFDLFFVPPRLAFAIADTQNLITFAVMLAIALLISTLTARLKSQVESGKARESRISALYDLGRRLTSLSGGVFLAAAAGRKVAELCGGEVAIYLGEAEVAPKVAFGGRTSIAADPVSDPAARWVIDHDQIAGAGTDTLPNAVALFLPLTASQRTVGALAVRTDPIDRILEPEGRRLLEACAGQLAMAVERDQMSIAASEAIVQAQAEQVRSALLSSVSHDLRTPLAVIAGAGSSLLQGGSLDESTRRQLLETIVEEADRLTRLLDDLLQMSKLEFGETAASKQWNILEEIVGSALGRVRRDLHGRGVEVRIPPDLPLVLVDGLLLEQVFVNLLENAARYTPHDTKLTITAVPDGKWLSISVADNGPGLHPGTEERIFEKFYRGTYSSERRQGSGLGLAICKAVVDVHGGTIRALNRPGGGVEFIFRLPLAENPPQVEPGEP
jgi:two-component system sensor histidine kinase KdpD